jgi:hypothetical protein
MGSALRRIIRLGKTVYYFYQACLSVCLSVYQSVRPSVCVSVPSHRVATIPIDGF